MERFWQDIRYGLRMLRKSPSHTIVAVLSLALGLGASTALFSVYDAVVMRPLPSVADPQSLVVLLWRTIGNQPMDSHSGFGISDGPGTPRLSGSFSYPLFRQFREQNVFSYTFAFYYLGRNNVQTDGTSELAPTLLVSGDYFDGLGLRPWAGRLLAAQDDHIGGEPAAVISHSYWLERFGGDPGAVGKAIFVNGRPFTIAGVVPRDFYGTIDYGSTPEIFLPLAYLDRLRPPLEKERTILEDNEAWWFGVMGRLKPGSTREAAHTALSVTFQHNVETLDDMRNPKPGAEPPKMPTLVLKPGAQGQSEFRQRNAQPLLVALAVVGVILLIACFNVANLLLARAGERQREVAVRMALGSHRRRLIRQLLTESLMLASMGGLLGVFFAWWGKELLFVWLPVSAVPETLAVPLNLRVLALAGACCVLTALIFGLAPAFHATRVDLANSLKDAAGSIAGSRPRQRLGRAMVVVQLALSVVVLAGAGLLLRTLINLEKSGTGFNSDNLLVFRLDGDISGYRGDKLANLHDEVRRRLQALPGVRSVAATRQPLITNSRSTRSASFLSYTPKPDERVSVHIQDISGDFFTTLRAPVLLGRDFGARDDQPGAPLVAIVNETIARRYFDGSNPVGQRMDFGSNQKEGKIEIVGVVRDMKYDRLHNDPPPTVYTPARQRPNPRDVTFMLRTAGDPNALAPAVTQLVRDLDSNLPVFGLRTQSDVIRGSLNRERESSSLLALFAGLALVLAAIGLYGLMAHTVSTRTNEIGIRLALGADHGKIFRMVLKQGLLLVTL
ncbi:MAG: ABC transporter permease, partial [Candidatus Acidiferrales bacterium]